MLVCGLCAAEAPTRAPPAGVCGAREWRCGDGTCIDAAHRCDRTSYECPDGTDEYDCGMCSTNLILPRSISSTSFRTIYIKSSDATCYYIFRFYFVMHLSDTTLSFLHFQNSFSLHFQVLLLTAFSDAASKYAFR